MEDGVLDHSTEGFVVVESTDLKETVEIAESSLLTDHSDQNEILSNPNFKPPKVSFDAIGEFCFESDHLALKGNTDYKNLLEAIVVLEAQRAKTLKDLNQLQRLKEEALSDPFEFLEQMKKSRNICFPKPQKIHPVPVIDWGKYALSGNPTAFEQRQINLKRQMTREFSRNNNKKTKLNQDVSIVKEKSVTSSWTEKEVTHLKELLIRFPPEDEEDMRWEKIANLLETQAPFEVAKWVHQHYEQLIEDSSSCVSQKPNLSYLRKRWGLQNLNKDGNAQDQQNSKESFVESKADISDDDEINPDVHNTPEFEELVLLKKVLREKVVEESSGLAQHIGYKCCRCKTEPIVGVRWHCIDCKPPLSIDFCEECAGCMYETRQHAADHQLEKQLVVKGFLDCDYMHFLGGDYNYLDPNYMPAT